jgi:2',3'-cyclic-nucleotide 2'-phosphodiesterase (5'-nucleotidase family)
LLKRWRKVGKTLVVQAGERFGHLGHLDLVGSSGSGLDASRSTWSVVPIGRQMVPNAPIRQQVTRLRAQLPAERIIGKRTVAWSLRGPGRARYGARVARAVAHHVASKGQAVDVTLLNSGGLRTNDTYPVGPVTNLEVRAIHPFGNRLVIAELSATELRAVLEHACTGGHRSGQGLRVLLHGLTMGCDRGQPKITYRRQNGRTVAIARMGQRVINLKIAGKELDPKRRYRLATNDYLARGGSGCWQLSQVARSCDDGEAMAADKCKRSATLAAVVEMAVKDGSFDQPLAVP